ncbi:hypothetical protein gpAD87_02360 [Paenibacillus sp. AD87]|nr:hypothetical protein gpAD87_02360 [Paenibacillus sp. AD87]
MYGEAGNIITGGQVVTLHTPLQINHSMIVITKHLPRHIALLSSSTEYGGVFVFLRGSKNWPLYIRSAAQPKKPFWSNIKESNHGLLAIHSYLQTLPEELIESVTRWPVFLLYAKLCVNFSRAF